MASWVDGEPEAAKSSLRAALRGMRKGLRCSRPGMADAGTRHHLSSLPTAHGGAIWEPVQEGNFQTVPCVLVLGCAQQCSGATPGARGTWRPVLCLAAPGGWGKRLRKQPTQALRCLQVGGNEPLQNVRFLAILIPRFLFVSRVSPWSRVVSWTLSHGALT